MSELLEVVAAGGQPNAVAALQNALTGLGSAYVEFGKAILAIDVGKAVKSADGPAGKKKKKEAKDKADKKPRAPSAYNIFIKEEGEKMRKAGNPAKAQDLMKEMGILWGKMTPSDKEKYSNKAKGIKVESPADTEDEEVPTEVVASSSSKKAREEEGSHKKRKKEVSSDSEEEEKKKKKKKNKKKKKKESSSSDSD